MNNEIIENSEKNAPILKQLSRKITLDEMSLISGAAQANTHYVNETVYVEDNGDGTASNGGIGGGTHPSYESYP